MEIKVGAKNKWVTKDSERSGLRRTSERRERELNGEKSRKWEGREGEGGWGGGGGSHKYKKPKLWSINDDQIMLLLKSGGRWQHLHEQSRPQLTNPQYG